MTQLNCTGRTGDAKGRQWLRVQFQQHRPAIRGGDFETVVGGEMAIFSGVYFIVERHAAVGQNEQVRRRDHGNQQVHRPIRSGLGRRRRIDAVDVGVETSEAGVNIRQWGLRRQGVLAGGACVMLRRALKCRHAKKPAAISAASNTSTTSTSAAGFHRGDEFIFCSRRSSAATCAPCARSYSPSKASSSRPRYRAIDRTKPRLNTPPGSFSQSSFSRASRKRGPMRVADVISCNVTSRNSRSRFSRSPKFPLAMPQLAMVQCNSSSRIRSGFKWLRSMARKFCCVPQAPVLSLGAMLGKPTSHNPANVPKCPELSLAETPECREDRRNLRLHRIRPH